MKLKVRYLVFFAACCSFTACVNDMETIHKIASNKEMKGEKVTNVTTYYSDMGNVKAKLTAPELIVYQTPEPLKELPKGLNLTFYNANKEVDGKLTALYGINYELKNTITVRRNVVVVNVKGEKLNTEELIWDLNKHTLFTNKFVRITTGNEQITGYGMEATEDFSSYKIKKVTGSVKVKDTTFD